MVTGGGDLRTDDGAGQAGASLNIGVWPEEAVFKDGTSFDDGVGANDVVAYQGGGGVDLGEWMDGGSTEWRVCLCQVGVQVRGAITEVPPVACVEDDAADAVAGFDELEEDGDDRLLFPRCEPVEERRTDHVDACEEMGAMVASSEEVPNVQQETCLGIDGDVGSWTSGAKGKGDEVASRLVMVDEGVERNIGENVAVVDEERIGTIKEVTDVGNAAGGLEAVGGFIAEVEGGVRVAGGGEGFRVGVGEVMGVDDDVTCARSDDMIEGGTDEGPMVEGD